MQIGQLVTLTDAGMKYYSSSQKSRPHIWVDRKGRIGRITKQGNIRVHWDGTTLPSCDAIPPRFLKVVHENETV